MSYLLKAEGLQQRIQKLKEELKEKEQRISVYVKRDEWHYHMAARRLEKSVKILDKQILDFSVRLRDIEAVIEWEGR